MIIEENRVQDDVDSQETREWLEAMHSVIRFGGKGRAAFLLKQLATSATDQGVSLPAAITTPYRNTIR
jgi:pyruvate dehydrogenase E1 component